MSLKQFQIESRLGQGSYSSVYKVKRITDGLQYAMKKVRLMNLNKKEKQNALNEVRILASIKHPNIIGYKQAFIDQASDSLIIIMEFASQGDLYRKINNFIKAGKEFSESQIWQIFTQIVRGLKVLHGLNIYHRDLKSANIFLCKNGAVKIGDLNVSKITDGLCNTQTGTPYFASPEIWKDQPYDHKSDIWALGCIMYQMAALKPPFRAEDLSGLYKKVLRGLYEKLPPQYSEDMSNTVRMMLQVIPQLRPDCDKLLQQIYLSQNDLLSKTQPTNKEGENILLDTIRVSKNMRMVSEKLPKPDYSMIQFDKIKKSESRNSCIKNPILPTISKNEQLIKKKRYVSERKRQKQVSIPSHQMRDRQKEQIKSGTIIELKQNPQIKKNISKKLKSSVSRPTFQLPFITQDQPSAKPRPSKKKSVKSSQ